MSVDIFNGKFNGDRSKIATNKGIVQGEPDFSKKNDVLANYLNDFEPSSKGQTHYDIGEFIGETGWDAIIVAESAYIADSFVIAGILGTFGGLALAGGIGIASVGIFEMFQETSSSTNSTGVSSFHLIDPKDLSFDGLGSEQNVKESYHLLDSANPQDSFHLIDTSDLDKMKKSLNEEMSSLEYVNDLLKGDHESHLGQLSERGVRETGNPHISENRGRD